MLCATVDGPRPHGKCNSLALPDVGAHFHGSEAAGAAALRQRARQRLASLASGKLLERKRYHFRGDF